MVFDPLLLPRKRIASSAFILKKNKLLMVKPNYHKEGWLLPGGVVEENETLWTACVREVKEELGISIMKGRLLALDYSPPHLIYNETLIAVFAPKVKFKINSICLQKSELDDFRFFEFSDAMKFAATDTASRLENCLKAFHKNKTLYLEGGKIA